MGGITQPARQFTFLATGVAPSVAGNALTAITPLAAAGSVIVDQFGLIGYNASIGHVFPLTRLFFPPNARNIVMNWTIGTFGVLDYGAGRALFDDTYNVNLQFAVPVFYEWTAEPNPSRPGSFSMNGCLSFPVNTPGGAAALSINIGTFGAVFTIQPLKVTMNVTFDV